MPLKLKHALNRDYLKVEILGQRTPGNEVAESKQIWKEVADVLSQQEQSRILTIMKVEGRLPIKSAFQIAESAGDLGWSRNYKMAVVAGSEAVLMNIRLSEMILTNLGYEIKLFGSTRMARKWLLSD
ncbi:hypothetical protein LVD13_07575 [Flavobacteriaceae bacterium D16]|nr:hypothetical protein [Flavobacteriaceae bacterium D16]